MTLCALRFALCVFITRSTFLDRPHDLSIACAAAKVATDIFADLLFRRLGILIEQGFPQREIAEAAFRYQQQLEREEKVMVGVNRFTESASAPIDILKIPASVETRQVRGLKEVRKRRNARTHRRALDSLTGAARGGDNLMPRILEAVEAYASVGEICEALKAVFGEYREEKTYF